MHPACHAAIFLYVLRWHWQICDLLGNPPSSFPGFISVGSVSTQLRTYITNELNPLAQRYPIQHGILSLTETRSPQPYPARVNTFRSAPVTYKTEHCNLASREWQVVEKLYSSLKDKTCLVDQSCFVTFEDEYVAVVACLRENGRGGFHYATATEPAGSAEQVSTPHPSGVMEQYYKTNMHKIFNFKFQKQHSPITFHLSRAVDSHWNLALNFPLSRGSSQSAEVKLRFYENGDFVEGTECFSNLGFGLQSLVRGGPPYGKPLDAVDPRIVRILHGKSVRSNLGFMVTFERTRPFVQVSVLDAQSRTHGPFSAVLEVKTGPSAVLVSILCPDSFKARDVPSIICDLRLTYDYRLRDTTILNCYSPIPRRS